MTRKRVLFVFLLLAVVVLNVLFIQCHKDLPLDEVKREYADSESRFLELDGMPVHYRDEGKGPALVLIHGMGASVQTWDAWTDRLKSAFRVIRMDLPGFGLTGPSPEGDYRVEAYVRFLHDFVVKLGLDSFSLAGSSLGGHIAWKYAVAYPKEVRNLILLDATGYPSPVTIPAVVLARVPGLNLLLRYCTPRAFVARNLRMAYADPSRVTDAVVNRYYRLLLREGNRQAFVQWAKTYSFGDGSEIPRIHVPTLILWGEEDRMVPVALARRFHADIAGSEIITYPKIGHLPMEEAPQESYEDVRTFISSPRH